MGSIFSQTDWPFGCLLLRNACLSLLPIFNWVIIIFMFLCVVGVAYILGKWTLSQIRGLQINPPILQVAFPVRWWCPWLCRNLFVWGGPTCPFLPLLPMVLVSELKKEQKRKDHYPNWCHAFLLLSLSSFMASGLTCTSLICLELMYTIWCGWTVQFHASAGG